jgi:hypothetical protein
MSCHLVCLKLCCLGPWLSSFGQFYWRTPHKLMNVFAGMLMDLISPLFPHAFVTLLCLGSLARSVSKYSLSSYTLKFTSTALLDIVFWMLRMCVPWVAAALSDMVFWMLRMCITMGGSSLSDMVFWKLRMCVTMGGSGCSKWCNTCSSHSALCAAQKCCRCLCKGNASTTSSASSWENVLSLNQTPYDRVVLACQVWLLMDHCITYWTQFL